MITIVKMTACEIKIFCFVLVSEVVKSIEVVTKAVMIPINKRIAMTVLDAFLGSVIEGQEPFTIGVTVAGAVVGKLI